MSHSPYGEYDISAGQLVRTLSLNVNMVTIRNCYQASSRNNKRRILDDFIAVTGHHRKYDVRLLAQSEEGNVKASALHTTAPTFPAAPCRLSITL